MILSMLKKAVVFYNKTTSDSLAFELGLENNKYGSLRILSHIQNKNSNPTMELFRNKTVLARQKIQDTTIVDLLNPGKYSLRLFKDLNNDGFWTSGNINNKVSPEPVIIHSKSIIIKSNWDLQVDIEDF